MHALESKIESIIAGKDREFLVAYSSALLLVMMFGVCTDYSLGVFVPQLSLPYSYTCLEGPFGQNNTRSVHESK